MAAKLKALLPPAARTGEVAPAPTDAGFPGGAAILRGPEVWVLAEEHPERSLGPSMILADRHGSELLNLVVSEVGGMLARRATLFDPAPAVWSLEGRSLVRARPDPADEIARPPSEAMALADLIRRAGAEPVVEGGLLRGEVLGLEVARVSQDETGPLLEVGVGRHDRQGHLLLHGDDPPSRVLAGVVQEVSRHRRPGAPSHPANQLAAERWLRSVVVSRPELVGASRLEPIGTSSELGRPCPAPAIGTDGDGSALLVVCSTGVDLDLLPAAADIRSATGMELLKMAIVLPEGDDHPATRAMAARLVEPAELRTVSPAWRELSPVYG